MAKHSDSLQLDLIAEAAEGACRRAISDLGWRILEDEGRRLVVKEVTPRSTSFTWSAKIEVTIEEGDPGSSVYLDGSITGFGPIQKGHLRGQLGALKNKIAMAARDAADDDRAATGGGDLGNELARLAELHRSGVLTDEEFAQAKAQLLAS